MSRSINKVILIGNLGSDPDQRFLPSGKAVANVSLATSESWLNKETNERVENTEWHYVVFFGRLAEIAGEYLKKGSKVYIEGQLQTRKWEQEGQTRYTTEIIARDMQFLDSRGSAKPSNQEEPGLSSDQSTPDVVDSSIDDDDIPF